MHQYLENGKRYCRSKVTISIGKYICAFDWHKIDDLELYKFEFSENFEGFRRYRTQQQLNE